jgi:hypothetical protein
MLAILGSGVMLCHEVKMSPECLIEVYSTPLVEREVGQFV